jgi:hypothetical protein
MRCPAGSWWKDKEQLTKRRVFVVVGRLFSTLVAQKVKEDDLEHVTKGED